MLIAESGSTKTVWKLCRDGKILKTFRTPGFNPNNQEEEDILEGLKAGFEINLSGEKIDEVIFYGAGLGGASQRAVMDRLLQKALPGTRVMVEHDMLAAARSTRRQEGIVCILGTGSNSCYHKDYQIVKSLGGHGYLFGDEGSGADLGRYLLKGLLQHDYPTKVRTYLEQQEGNTIYEIKIQVHHADSPNVRMAELAQHISPFFDVPEIREMVTGRMLAFLDTTVCRYENYEQLTVDFVGSIAFFFREFLEEACRMRAVRIGEIVKDPVDNLVAFHLMGGAQSLTA